MAGEDGKLLQHEKRLKSLAEFQVSVLLHAMKCEFVLTFFFYSNFPQFLRTSSDCDPTLTAIFISS